MSYSIYSAVYNIDMGECVCVVSMGICVYSYGIRLGMDCYILIFLLLIVLLLLFLLLFISQTEVVSATCKKLPETPQSRHEGYLRNLAASLSDEARLAKLKSCEIGIITASWPRLFPRRFQ